MSPWLVVILEHLPGVTVAAAIIGSMASLVNAGLAIRAKGRLRTILSGSEQLSSSLRHGRILTDDDEKAAKAVILAASSKLSKQDRSFIERGINQTSRAGERRYIEEVTSTE